jgi:hypothetical protein
MKKYLFIVVTICTSYITYSQDSVVATNKSVKKWNFLIEPYVMAANLQGTIGLGQLPDVSVNASPGDIFSHLQIGAMLNVEASHGNWAFASDILYMSLKQDVSTNKLIAGGGVTAKQFAWELAGLYRVNPWLEAGVGTMLNSLKSGVNIEVNTISGGPISLLNKEISKTWVDPMLMVRVGNKAGQKFIYSLRAEIGGFGIGSKFAWQIQAYAGYRFSKLLQVTGGYRVIGINYDKGSGDSRFVYDIDTFGPAIRFGFNF